MQYETRQLSQAALVKILIRETTLALGQDANFLGEKISFRRRAGRPNWDATIGLAGMRAIMAFAIALKKVQADYDLD
jgi:hypothetical protein